MNLNWMCLNINIGVNNNMKYNGKELVEMTPEMWDGKTRKMLVWTDVSNPVQYGNLCHIKTVIGYSTEKLAWVISDKRLDYWPHCAEITKEESNQAQSTDEMIEVMNAYTEGKKIECRFKDIENDEWTEITFPRWNWDVYDYRIKLEPVTGNVEGLKRSLKYVFNALDIRNKQIENLEKENEELKETIESLKAEKPTKEEGLNLKVGKWYHCYAHLTVPNAVRSCYVPTAISGNFVFDGEYLVVPNASLIVKDNIVKYDIRTTVKYEPSMFDTIEEL